MTRNVATDAPTPAPANDPAAAPVPGTDRAGAPGSPGPLGSARAGRATKGSAREKAIVWAGRILVPVVVIGAWQLAVDSGRADPFFVGQPSRVWSFLLDEGLTADMARDMWVTLQETLVGFVVGSTAGIATGLVLARFRLLYAIFTPYLTALNALPRIALAPLFVLWFGIGMQSKVVLVISIVFFILMSATLGAVRNVDPDLVRLSRVIGFSTRRTFLHVHTPWAVPGIFAGLQLGMIYAFLAAVAGEMISARAGVGQRLQYYSGTFNTSAMLGTLALLAVVATALSLAMDLVRRRIMRYRAD
ncbi:MAG: ABC transporter permease [Acidimicrobiia bacterium]